MEFPQYLPFFQRTCVAVSMYSGFAFAKSRLFSSFTAGWDLVGTEMTVYPCPEHSLRSTIQGTLGDDARKSWAYVLSSPCAWEAALSADVLSWPKSSESRFTWSRECDARTSQRAWVVFCASTDLTTDLTKENQTQKAHCSWVCVCVHPAKNGMEYNTVHPRELQTYPWSSYMTSCRWVAEYWFWSQNLYRFLRWHDHYLSIIWAGGSNADQSILKVVWGRWDGLVISDQLDFENLWIQINEKGLILGNFNCWKCIDYSFFQSKSLY